MTDLRNFIGSLYKVAFKNSNHFCNGKYNNKIGSQFLLYTMEISTIKRGFKWALALITYVMNAVNSVV
jgi:hypothetical protein